MQAGRTIRLIWTFYRSFIFPSLLATIACVSAFWKYGFSIYTAVFWFKIATLGLIYYFINGNKAKEYFYYQNLGVSKALLWIVTLTFDFAVFLLLIILTNNFK